MKQYLDTIQAILEQPPIENKRTGTWTKRIIGVLNRYDLSGGKVAIPTVKKTNYAAALDEDLNLFVPGNHNINDIKSKIWDAWAGPDGDLGPIYGVQARRADDYQIWRDDLPEKTKQIIREHYTRIGQTDEGEPIFHRRVDQLARAIKMLREDPTSRQILVDHWNPAQLDLMALPPCHMAYQFLVTEGKLTLVLIQRSADVYLGVPFNITQYSAKAHMVAQVTGLEAVELVHFTSDTHLYENQWQAAEELLSLPTYDTATIKLNPLVTEIDDFTVDDIEIVGYQSGPFKPVTVVV